MADDADNTATDTAPAAKSNTAGFKPALLIVVVVGLFVAFKFLPVNEYLAALLKYIERKRLNPRDRLFTFSHAFFNRKLRRIAEQVFGDKIPHPTSDYYKNLNMYDLRHSGAVHFRILAKDNPGHISLDALRHRGGWVDFDMLNYYTQFIGLDGKIERQGMLLKQDQHKIEKDLAEEKKKRLALERKLQSLAKRFEAVLPMIEES